MNSGEYNMTRLSLLLKSLAFYWRTNLAVWLGVVAATAVVGGALVVGDSVRGSLREMTLARLGRIDHVLQGGRFFRQALAAELASQPDVAKDFTTVAPAIVMECSVERAPNDAHAKLARAGKVNLYGIGADFWSLTEHADYAPPTERAVVLNQRLADDLSAKVGDEVEIFVEMPAEIPRDSLLGGKDKATTTQILRLTVAAVIESSVGVGRLGLQPNQQLPPNLFISLPTLQEELGVSEERRSRSNPEGRDARVNALFVSGKSATSTPEDAEKLTTALPEVLQLKDLDLRISVSEPFRYLSVESDRMILEDTVAETASEVAAERKWATSPVLVYLANELSTEKTDDTYSMYSVVAGLDLNNPAFGPYEYVGESPTFPLGADDMVINAWLAKDMQAEIGDEVTVEYHLVGSRGELPEEEHIFKVAGILQFGETTVAEVGEPVDEVEAPAVKNRAEDRGITPEVKGITDADTLADWEQPFQMKFGRITSRDEAYWDDYKATPKAFVSLETAQNLWKSRYGKLTSFRMAVPEDMKLADAEADVTRQLIEKMPLPALGMAFRPVKFQGLQAANGTTDFSVLFVSFSFFLIISATFLIGLLFRLGIERRVTNIGLLAAVGYSPKLIRKLFLGEGLLVVLSGGLTGLVAAVVYAWLMLFLLRTLWNQAVGTTALDLFVTPVSLAVGFVISVGVAMMTVGWALRQLRNISVRDLMGGVSQEKLTAEQLLKRSRIAPRTTAVCVGITGALIVGILTGMIPDVQAFGGLSWQTVSFFVAGMCSLIASLTFISTRLQAARGSAVQGRGMLAMERLGVSNSGRHRSRSVMTVALIAFATFVIVAVAAGQRNPAREAPDFYSGNGGYTLVAESATPLLYDLNTDQGREKLNLTDYETLEELAPIRRVMPFRVRPGEDASCLNLFQTTVPTILGVPEELIERGGFKFVGGGEKPWLMLNEKLPDGSVPVFGDMNTLMYSMHKAVGDQVPLPGPVSPERTLTISAMMDGAIFQGVLLMAEDRFQELFPEEAGYQYFLIEVDPKDAPQVREALESGLNAYGFDVEMVGQRLADFLAVQNTYLSTFQALGGLGLLLGTFGLATVMLRNVLERRKELALMRALGFRNSQLAALVLWENAYLLMWGVLGGTVSALIAMMPHLVSIGGDMSWPVTLGTLAAVLFAGMCSAYFAVREALRTPVLATLRSEQ